MIGNEYAIGNYLATNAQHNALQIEPIDRESMVALLQELHRVKKYHVETLFLACSIADRFLTNLAQKNFCAPNLVQLATVCLLMAAKMTEHINPSFDIMISILPKTLQHMATKNRLIQLEAIIIRTLDFDMSYDGPIPFLERYMRLLDFDSC